MDQHMSFEETVHEIHKKVTGILLLVNRTRDKFDAVTRKIVIQSLASSDVNYCRQADGTTNNMQKLQDFAAKICAGDARSDHATSFITQLVGWFRLRSVIYIYIYLVLCIRCVFMPFYLFHFLPPVRITTS